MDIYKAWNRAIRNTEIIRSRVQGLMTFQETRVPYIFLAESEVNLGDTVVRQGEIVVEKPTLVLPPNVPQFQGFQFENDFEGTENDLVNLLLVRGITLPSFKYNNKTHQLDIFEGKLSQAIKHYLELLQREENVRSGLLTGPEDCWQFSVLVFICSQIARNANTDIRRILDEYKKRSNG